MMLLNPGGKPPGHFNNVIESNRNEFSDMIMTLAQNDTFRTMVLHNANIL